jgi:hypothetical protein
MKRKNVVVDEYIIAKNKHGGAGSGNMLTKGQGYKVAFVESEPYYGDLFCAIQVGDDNVFWVDPQHFRKQK